jgi:hypothetical protein
MAPKKRKISDREELLVQEGEWKGSVVEVDASGSAVAVSTRRCRDVDRPDKVMPSLKAFPGLQSLDLYKCRYVTNLDESVVDLTNLTRLSLTGCSRLQSIPSTIGRLQALEEVSFPPKLRPWEMRFIYQCRFLTFKCRLRCFSPSWISRTRPRSLFCPTRLVN